MNNVDYSKLVLKGHNTITFETTKAGYKVSMNDVDLKPFAEPKTSTQYLIKSELGFPKIQQVEIKGLKAKMKNMKIGPARNFE